MKIECSFLDKGIAVGVKLICDDGHFETYQFKRPLRGDGFAMQGQLMEALEETVNILLEKAHGKT